jgi:hypothetical protein
MLQFPFTAAQFLEVFSPCNQAVFPFQIMLCLLAVAAVVFPIKHTLLSDRLICGILSFFWLWMGVVCHFLFFSAINLVAVLFGILFIAEAVLLVSAGVIGERVRFRNVRSLS